MIDNAREQGIRCHSRLQLIIIKLIQERGIKQ